MDLFQPASRQKARLRMALQGVSGGGKTLGALYIAYGMTGDWGKVALIDTEHGRARAYAGRSDLPTPTGAFLYVQMEPPFSPEKYKEYARAGAEAVGTDGVLIIDSLSHAWTGEGGVLERKDAISARAGNSFTAWNEAGKLQNDLVDTLLSLPCHTIVTLRVKTEYVMQLNERGKQEPVKVGLAPVQRDNVEYEFDITLNIARDHTAVTGKDVTFLDGFRDVITPALGRDLAAWLNEGKEPPPRLRCADCTRIIQDSRQRDGTVVTAQECAARAEAMFGRKLCKSCLLKAIRAAKEEQKEGSADGAGTTAQ